MIEVFQHCISVVDYLIGISEPWHQFRDKLFTCKDIYQG